MAHNHLSPVSYLAIMVVLFFAPQAHADIYKYVDKYGRVYLTDRPSHTGYKRIVRTWKGWTIPSGKGYADSGKNVDSMPPPSPRRHSGISYLTPCCMP